MVDFNAEKIHLYLPKNLSYEKESFRRYFDDSLFLQGLCDIRNNHFLHQKSNNSINKQIISRISRGAEAKISCTAEALSANTNSSDTNILVALDLASSKSCSSKSNTTATKSKVIKWEKIMDDELLKTDASEVRKYDSKCNKFLENLACGLKSLAKRPLSPSSLSDTDTVFSEDYMRMTDIGEDSNSIKSLETDCSVHHNSENHSTSSFDSTMSFSNASMGTLEDEDLERVTLQLKTMELTPEDPFKSMANHLVSDGLIKSECKNEPEITNPIDIPQKKVGVGGRRIKEKELPKIKLLMSKSPPNPDMFEKGLALLPSDQLNSTEQSPPASSGSLFVDQEFDYLETDKVKRSTSLKTYKTPPGTPHRKKVVRFADAMGLDLEDVKHVMNMDDPPNIPDSAMKDLKVGLEEEHKTEGTKYLSACFSQPGSSRNFIQLVNDTKLKLENCLVDGQDMTISGTVRVANITFHKRVVIRYTINNWTTFTDVFASYVQNSNDGMTDRFSFTISVPNYFSNGDKLQFAVMLDCGGQQFWDNNNGNNYTVECYAVAVPITGSDNLWMHFL